MALVLVTGGTTGGTDGTAISSGGGRTNPLAFSALNTVVTAHVRCDSSQECDDLALSSLPSGVSVSFDNSTWYTSSHVLGNTQVSIGPKNVPLYLKQTSNASGATGSFTTAGTFTAGTAPTLSGALTATAGSAKVTLTGPTASDNVGIDHWVIEYGLAGLYGSTQTVSSTSTTFPSTDVTGLTNGTSYGFRVKAYDAAGNASGTLSGTATPASLMSGIVTSGLVGSWAGQYAAGSTQHANADGNVGTWYDLSGNGHNLTATGFPTPPTTSNGWSTSSPYPLVMPSTGNGGYYDTTASTAFGSTGDFTVEAWVKPNSPAAGHVYVVGKGNLSTTSYAWWLDTYGTPYRMRLVLGTDASGGTIAFATASTPTITDTAWNHIAATVSGTTVALYINGTAMSGGGTYSGTRQVGASKGIAIGVQMQDATVSYCGSIGEVRYYSAALSSSDISTNYNARKSAYGL